MAPFKYARRVSEHVYSNSHADFFDLSYVL
jgi:hypothetical protein